MTGIHRLSKKDAAPGVGRDMEAHCTRCKAEHDHTIIAMVGDVVVQVRCNTCGSLHKYKAPKRAAASKGASRQRTSRAAKPSAKATATEMKVARRRFQRRLEELDPDRAISYSPRIRPELGQLVRHVKFGLGIVNSVLAGKAAIEFADGEKLLVIGR